MSLFVVDEKSKGYRMNIDTLADLRVVKSLFAERQRKGCSHAFATFVEFPESVTKFYCPDCGVQGVRISQSPTFLRAGIMVAFRLIWLSLKSVGGSVTSRDRVFLRNL